MSFVSDHALVRYIERVQGLDLGPIRREVEAKVAGAVAARASKITIDGVTYVFADSSGGRVVATILTAEMSAAGKQRYFEQRKGRIRGRNDRAVSS